MTADGFWAVPISGHLLVTEHAERCAATIAEFLADRSHHRRVPGHQSTVASSSSRTEAAGRWPLT
jgi:hypothetical protein